VAKESWHIGLPTGNRQAVTRTNTAVLTPHTATFGKSITGQQIMYSFVAKEAITTKKRQYGNRIY
jgi:hypothetical protein